MPAATSPEGASAVVELARQIVRLHAMVDLDAGITLNVAPVWGGSAAERDRGRGGLRDRSAGADAWRRASGWRRRSWRCSRSTPAARVSVTGGMNRPPMAETPAILALYEQARAAAAAAGFELPKQHRGGGSDGNFTAALGIPTLDGLGCPGAGAHASHEHIQWRALAPRAAMLASFAGDAA